MTYQPRAVTAPRLAGAGLRAFARLVEQPMSGQLVRDALLRQLGLDALRAYNVDGFGPDPGPLPADRRAWPRAPEATPELRAPPPRPGPSSPDVFTFHQRYREGVSPLAVAERYLDACARSEAHSPPLRALIAQDPADIRRQASMSAARWSAGRPLGLLDGVPVSIKDELDQIPYPTTGGTRRPVAPARSDATVVARLRAAGAMLVGKANMHELGSGLSGINPHWGTPRNPWDPSRICGGSSSGSGALVAAGLAPLSIGCDAGGSIRMPAALCGIVGLKPTYGRISHHGAFDLVWTTSHAGPMGRSVADVAAAYLAIAGPDPQDWRTLSQPPVHLDGWDQMDLRGVTLGVYRDWFESAQPEIVEVCRAQVRAWRELGAEVREVVLPDLEALGLAHLVLIGAEAAESQMIPYDADKRVYSHESRVSMALSRGLSAVDYAHARRVRSRLIRRWLDATAGLDAIVTPATGCLAPPLLADAEPVGESDMATAELVMRFMAPGNLLGFPGITFPVGYDGATGLPIAIQVLGRPWMEHTLLRLARAAELGFERRKPKMWFGEG